MEYPITDTLLHRFFVKETSEEENKQILSWVSSSKANRDEFKKLHELFYLSNSYQSKVDVDKAWMKLSSELLLNAPKPKILYIETFRKIAVIALLVLTVGFGSLWSIEHFSKVGNTVVDFIVPKGEKSKIILADGSQVWINSETKFSYDALLPRKATINGEAYFEIKKDSSNPFEVETESGLKVTVTGTKFNLRSFENESFVETTLEEGEVFITGTQLKGLTKLVPGEQAVYNIKSRKVTVNNVSPELFSSWRKNEMRFFEASLYDIIPQIERWYGVSIKIEKGLNLKSRITMTVKTESIRELFEMLKLTSNFDYEIDGARIKIHAN